MSSRASTASLIAGLSARFTSVVSRNRSCATSLLTSGSSRLEPQFFTSMPRSSRFTSVATASSALALDDATSFGGFAQRNRAPPMRAQPIARE